MQVFWSNNIFYDVQESSVMRKFGTCWANIAPEFWRSNPNQTHKQFGIQNTQRQNVWFSLADIDFVR